MFFIVRLIVSISNHIHSDFDIFSHIYVYACIFGTYLNKSCESKYMGRPPPMPAHLHGPSPMDPLRRRPMGPSAAAPAWVPLRRPPYPALPLHMQSIAHKMYLRVLGIMVIG